MYVMETSPAHNYLDSSQDIPLTQYKQICNFGYIRQIQYNSHIDSKTDKEV